MGRPRLNPEHGTMNKYRQGCRDGADGGACNACKQANLEYFYNNKANQQALQLGLPMPETSHGTRSGYRDWECRCEECSAYAPRTRKQWQQENRERLNEYRRNYYHYVEKPRQQEAERKRRERRLR